MTCCIRLKEDGSVGQYFADDGITPIDVPAGLPSIGSYLPESLVLTERPSSVPINLNNMAQASRGYNHG